MDYVSEKSAPMPPLSASQLWISAVWFQAHAPKHNPTITASLTQILLVV